MKLQNRILALALIGASFLSLQSCEKENSKERLYTALVTYEVNENGVRFQLDDSTALIPTNIDNSLYKDKKVRALINYTYEKDQTAAKEASARNIKVHTIDTIRTKLPVEDLGDLNDKTYGTDRLEIINDWVSVAEDGFLTLRIRTFRGDRNAMHYINLVSLGKKDDAYEYEIRHDAGGDIYGFQSDGLIAFDLNSLAPADHSPVKLHLKWSGFTTEKDLNCKLTFRNLQ